MPSRSALPPSSASISPAPITHYENFPVASILCPPALRGPIAAIYAFARTADDIADEGSASAAERLADLSAYRHELAAIADPTYSPPARWAAVFGPLQAVLHSHKLPLTLLDDLLSAFIQDVQYTHEGTTYRDRAALLHYCSRSANPVGRLLLHLYGVHTASALAQSDAICSALQLINFWQDVSVDIPRARHYLTDADCAAHGVTRTDLQRLQPTPTTEALLADNAQWARRLMWQGSPLVHSLPGRVGWELRLVVQGGLRILDKIDALHGRNLCQRPVLGPLDGPVMLWRAVRMPRYC